MKPLIASLILMVACVASNATPISFGALSSDDDGSTEIIEDSLNGLSWLRWDVLADLTYAETLSAITPGGIYEGWQIAGISEALLFTNALLFGRTNNCDGTTTAPCNTDLPSNLTSLLGDSFSPGEDFAWFLSDNGTGEEVGFLQYTTTAALQPLLTFSLESQSIAGSDRYS